MTSSWNICTPSRTWQTQKCDGFLFLNACVCQLIHIIYFYIDSAVQVIIFFFYIQGKCVVFVLNENPGVDIYHIRFIGLGIPYQPIISWYTYDITRFAYLEYFKKGMGDQNTVHVFTGFNAITFKWGDPDICWPAYHDDVIKWKHFSRSWPSPVNSPHKGRWRGAFVFSLICARINSWVNNGEAGDLRRHLAHYDATVICQRIPYRWSAPGLDVPRLVGMHRRRSQDALLLSSTYKAIIKLIFGRFWSLKMQQTLFIKKK